MKKALIAVMPFLLIISLAVLAHAQDIPDNETAQEKSRESSLEKKGPHKGYGYIGLGVIGGEMSEDDETDRTTGPGLHLLWGVNRGHFGVELTLGALEDNSFFGFGIKFNILPYNEYKVTPWIGIDGYVLDVLTNEDRGCFAPALGLDIRLTKRMALRLGALHCSYTEDLSWPLAGRSVTRDLTLLTLDMLFLFSSP